MAGKQNLQTVTLPARLASVGHCQRRPMASAGRFWPLGPVGIVLAPILDLAAMVPLIAAVAVAGAWSRLAPKRFGWRLFHGTIPPCLAVSIWAFGPLRHRRPSHLCQKDYLVKEVNHRVQNSLQLVSAFLSMQTRSLEDPTDWPPHRGAASVVGSGLGPQASLSRRQR